MRTIVLSLALFLSCCLANAQTYFYIDEIAVQPSSPTSSDVVSIDLIGGLSSTGAFVVSASASMANSVVSIAISAADPGGFAVIVPHTETITIGTLAPGSYSIVINGQAVADMAPTPHHAFTVSGSGNVCDYLTIQSIQWHAFTDTALVLHVTNIGSTIFDYPNFILFNAVGDTLAKEVVNFFGIGQDSWHMLRVMDGANLPTTPFFGTLELWQQFTEELACSWSGNYELCPPLTCATLIPRIDNFGGALTIGDYDWAISDDVGEVATGTFTMTAQMQYDTDTICLPPGNYWIYAIPLQEPTGGQPWYGVSTEGWITGPAQPLTWALPALMPFSFYANCLGGTNAVHSPNALLGPLLSQSNGSIFIQAHDGSDLGMLRVFDMHGNLLHATRTHGSTAHVSTLDWAAGVYAVTLGSSRPTTVRFVIDR